MLSFELFILELCWILEIESILDLILWVLGLLGVFCWILDIEFASGKHDQFLFHFRHLVKDWKVKLDVEKLGFELIVWDLKKGSPIEKLLTW